MKKICYGLCLLLATVFVSNVYAKELLGSIVRGESYLLENYNSGVCENTEAYIAFETEDGCLLTNNLSSSVTKPLSVIVYTDNSTSPATNYKIELLGTEISHQSGKVIPYELTYLINNENSVARKSYIENMTVETGTAGWFIYAGYLNDNDNDNYKIYVYYGNEELGYVVPYEYNTSTRVMSYAYDSPHPTEIQVAATLASHYLFFFLVESDPNFVTEAKAIMQDKDKLALVDVVDLFNDGISDWSLSTDSNTVFNFAMLLIDNKADAFVNSYNEHSNSGESDPDPLPVTPPADPDPLPVTPPADPTQPTQPTEPVKQPNTGTYLPLIGVMWLAMFGMVFIYCRKTMFKKI